MKRAPRPKKAPALMLTSLLDMFTIILIFLIVSFEAEDYEFKLNPDLTLPESYAQSVFKPAVNVSITMDGIIVSVPDAKGGDAKQVPVTKLTKGQATKEAYEAGQIDEVVEVLGAIHRQKMEMFEDRGPTDADEGFEGVGEGLDVGSATSEGESTTDDEDELAGTIILLQADKGLDYKTLYLVMRSARIAGFSKYRLAIMKK